MRKLIPILLCLTVFLSSFAISYAIGSPVNLVINEKEIPFSGMGAYIDVNGRTQVPLRAISEEMGYGVHWDGPSSSIHITRINENKTEVDCTYFVIGEKRAVLLNAKGKELSTADNPDVLTQKTGGLTEVDSVVMNTSPVIVYDRTYIPVAYLSDLFGLSTKWHSPSSTLHISTVSQDVANENPQAVGSDQTIVLSNSADSTQGATTAVNYVGMPDGGYYFSQSSIPSGGCVITCMAMIGSNLNGTEITPKQAYTMNGSTVYYQWSKLDNALGITNKMRLDVRGYSLEDKINQIISSIENYPGGVMLSFVSGSGSRHSVVATWYDLDNGILYVNDSSYGENVPFDQCWTGERMLNTSKNDLEYLVQISCFE